MELERSSPRRNVSPPSPLALLVGTFLLLLSVSCGNTDDGEGASASDLIEKAYPAFAEAMGRTSWPPPSPGMAQIRQAMSSGSMGRVRMLVEQELARNPDNLQATFILSEILFRSAQYGAARPGFEKVLERGPSFPGGEYTFLAYGRCLLSLGEGEQARESLLAFLKLQPGNGEALSVLGLLEIADGNPDQAILYLDQAVKVFETLEAQRGADMTANRAKMLASKAEAWLQKDELENARSSLRSSLQLNPTDPQTHYTLSRVLTRLGDAEGARRAMRDFERVKAEASRSPNPQGGRQQH